jgi:hypothetical protein
MFSQCQPVVRQIEAQQTRALAAGSLRRVLTLFRVPQTGLRLFVHVAEAEEGRRCSCAIGSDYKADAPKTGDNVQAWAADDPEDDDLTYVQVTCLACAQAHLVNPKNGKVLGGSEYE